MQVLLGGPASLPAGRGGPRSTHSENDGIYYSLAPGVRCTLAKHLDFSLYWKPGWRYNWHSLQFDYPWDVSEMGWVWREQSSWFQNIHAKIGRQGGQDQASRTKASDLCVTWSAAASRGMGPCWPHQLPAGRSLLCLLQNCQGKVRQANFCVLLCVDRVPTLWADLSFVTFVSSMT